MAESSPRSTGHRDAVRRVREAQSFALDLPVLGRVRIPRPEQLAFYGAVCALVAAEIIEWPIALVLATGHALQQNEHCRVAQQIGEALGDA